MTRRVAIAGGVGSLIGFALLALGLAVDPRRAFFAYLTAFGFGLTVALGAMGYLMIGYVSGARWFVALRRIAETIVGTVPLFLLLFVPIALGLHELYPWAVPDRSLPEALREAVLAKRAYLNPPFFLLRAAVFLATWALLAELLVRWPDGRNGESAVDRIRRLRTTSGAGFPVLALTLTFASVDWFMSLEPSWYSNAYGFYVITGALLAGVAVVTLFAYLARRSGALPVEVGESHFHASGKVLLSTVALWSYIAFVQFLILWIADVPEEITWFRVRLSGSWLGLSIALAAGKFVIPFLLLLQRAITRRAERLAIVCAWLLFAQYADMYLLIEPVLHPEGLRPHWLDLSALLAVGGAMTALGALRVRTGSALPANDPLLPASLRYESL